MKEPSKTPYSPGERNPKLLWEADLAVKDLVQPLTLRRIRLFQTAGVIVLLLAAGVAGWWLFLRPESGEKMVKDMIAAAGGMEAWQNVKDGSFVRTHRLYDENGRVIKQSSEAFSFRNTSDGHQVLIKTRTPEGGQVLLGRDKGGYWASLDEKEVDPKKIAEDMELMCDDEGCSPLCAVEMALYRMSFPFKLADGGVIPRNGGTAVLNGEKVQLLDVTFDPKVGHDRWVFYTDPATKFIRKIEHYPSMKDNVQPEEIFLSDFKKEGGIVLSHSNKYYRSNGKLLEEYQVSDVKFNASLAPDIFDKPAALASN
ncbi:hypothetical protein SAMN00120144_2048 [Hymenobacter roseosalivarius DSM 11622]|uniref:Uncharacterized protein n=1 Tax=Hymenobacter roseosalivarius DSM 11622 TaxID=645990 RepID=A0A1W1VNL3_9BACT|nr:hypothetical protein [Hymenobacter roseosalivarius]SMB94651.1 hypothetical protein SAMN00120144_2048 [Hymenobacter roseosalivarius DSM 11622]